MSELRTYQQNAVGELRQAVADFGSAVYCLATGAGKTKIAGEISRLAAAKGSRTIFLVHRRELVHQTLETLRSDCPGVQVGAIASGFPECPWAPLQVASIQTLARRERVATPALYHMGRMPSYSCENVGNGNQPLAERQTNRLDGNPREVGR